jgi:hypothetical protein
MKTAVEWLANELTYKTNDGRYIVDNTDDVTDIVNQAILIYEEQIKDAYKAGYNNGNIDTCLTSEQYYNETFKQQEQ